MSTRFFTNRRNNTLIEKFSGVFVNNPDILSFDALRLIDRHIYALHHLTATEIKIVEGPKS